MSRTIEEIARDFDSKMASLESRLSDPVVRVDANNDDIHYFGAFRNPYAMIDPSKRIIMYPIL
ncbi:MAG: hypothetical protein IJ584_03405 [Bacteroidales bacterium]|nr:hypothetical protein [Bacteroidales bacterium]